MMFATYPDLVNIQELKQMLGIGVNLAYRLVRTNTIPSIKVGREYKIPKRLEPIVKSFLLELKEKQEKNKELCGDSYNKEYLEYICVDNCGNLIRPDYVTETFLS